MAETLQEFKLQFKELHSLYVSVTTNVSKSNPSGGTDPTHDTKNDFLPDSSGSGGHSHTGDVQGKEGSSRDKRMHAHAQSRKIEIEFAKAMRRRRGAVVKSCLGASKKLCKPQCDAALMEAVQELLQDKDSGWTKVLTETVEILPDHGGPCSDLLCSSLEVIENLVNFSQIHEVPAPVCGLLCPPLLKCLKSCWGRRSGEQVMRCFLRCCKYMFGNDSTVLNLDVVEDVLEWLTQLLLTKKAEALLDKQRSKSKHDASKPKTVKFAGKGARDRAASAASYPYSDSVSKLLLVALVGILEDLDKHCFVFKGRTRTLSDAGALDEVNPVVGLMQPCFALFEIFHVWELGIIDPRVHIDPGDVNIRILAARLLSKIGFLYQKDRDMPNSTTMKSSRSSQKDNDATVPALHRLLNEAVDADKGNQLHKLLLPKKNSGACTSAHLWKMLIPKDPHESANIEEIESATAALFCLIGASNSKKYWARANKCELLLGLVKAASEDIIGSLSTLAERSDPWMEVMAASLTVSFVMCYPTDTVFQEVPPSLRREHPRVKKQKEASIKAFKCFFRAKNVICNCLGALLFCICNPPPLVGRNPFPARPTYVDNEKNSGTTDVPEQDTTSSMQRLPATAVTCFDPELSTLPFLGTILRKLIDEQLSGSVASMVTHALAKPSALANTTWAGQYLYLFDKKIRRYVLAQLNTHGTLDLHGIVIRTIHDIFFCQARSPDTERHEEMINFQRYVIKYLELLSCLDQSDLEFHVENFTVVRVLQIWRTLKISLTSNRPSFVVAAVPQESKYLAIINDCPAFKLAEVLIQTPFQLHGWPAVQRDRCGVPWTWCSMLESVELLVQTGYGPQIAQSNFFEKLASYFFEVSIEGEDFSTPNAETKGRTSQGGSDVGSVDKDFEFIMNDRDCKRLNLRVCKLLFNEILKFGRIRPQLLAIFVKMLKGDLKVITRRWDDLAGDDEDASSTSGQAEEQESTPLKCLPTDSATNFDAVVGEYHMMDFTLATKLPSIDAEAPKGPPEEPVEDLVLDIIHVKEICEALHLICKSKEQMLQEAVNTWIKKHVHLMPPTTRINTW